MDLKRFFTDKIIKDKIYLEGEEFVHAVKVTRHKVGYKIIVCNGTSYDYYATITDIGKDSLVATVDDVVLNTSETDHNITLYIGINKDMDTVIQKCVEMGVKKVAPFVSQHSNLEKINYERLNKIVLESSKQCGRASLMEILPITTFQEAINVAKDTKTLLFYEFERETKVKDISIEKDDIAVIIGSEGGFSAEEIALAKSVGAEIATLGNRILRVSTAVVSGLTLCLEQAGEI